tara:strand:+ start:656 stop:802 length:147 start_codon:yes stop_codon:yes gene_type:complete
MHHGRINKVTLVHGRTWYYSLIDSSKKQIGKCFKRQLDNSERHLLFFL